MLNKNNLVVLNLIVNLVVLGLVVYLVTRVPSGSEHFQRRQYSDSAMSDAARQEHGKAYHRQRDTEAARYRQILSGSGQRGRFGREARRSAQRGGGYE